LGITIAMDNLVRDDTPQMSVGMHAICTLLGLASAVLTAYLAYGLFESFSWALLGGTLCTFFFAEEFFRGAVTRRYPGWILVFLLPP
jgi:hypothetical protein